MGPQADAYGTGALASRCGRSWAVAFRRCVRLDRVDHPDVGFGTDARQASLAASVGSARAVPLCSLPLRLGTAPVLAGDLVLEPRLDRGRVFRGRPVRLPYLGCVPRSAARRTLRRGVPALSHRRPGTAAAATRASQVVRPRRLTSESQNPCCRHGGLQPPRSSSGVNQVQWRQTSVAAGVL